jgi:hypothetical protein
MLGDGEAGFRDLANVPVSYLEIDKEQSMLRSKHTRILVI